MIGREEREIERPEAGGAIPYIALRCNLDCFIVSSARPEPATTHQMNMQNAREDGTVAARDRVRCRARESEDRSAFRVATHEGDKAVAREILSLKKPMRQRAFLVD
jgi:hypothetical protein